LFAAPLLAFLVAGTSAQAQDADPAAQAHQHYQAGVSLFEAGNKEQALVEFQLANELVPKKANLFMIAQCQYHLGLLKEARANYQEFLAQPTSEELADIARLRIEAINHRPGVLAINTVPDQVQVRIEGEGQVFTGEAPNEFRVPRGRYRVTVSKPNFVRQERDITIDVAETKPCSSSWIPSPHGSRSTPVPATPPSMCEATARRTPTHSSWTQGTTKSTPRPTTTLPATMWCRWRRDNSSRSIFPCPTCSARAARADRLLDRHRRNRRRHGGDHAARPRPAREPDA
jgi:hypothetical protein